MSHPSARLGGIERLIKTAGLSVNDVADRTGIARATLQRRLRSPRGLTLAEIANVANVLDVPIASVVDAALGERVEAVA